MSELIESKVGAQLMARLLAAPDGAEGEWQPAELEAIWRHQLWAPLRVDLAQCGAGVAGGHLPFDPVQWPELERFGDVLHHARPPVELLKLVKDFAKAHLEHPQSPLPREIATALYYTSIAAALRQLGKRITHLEREPLRAGLEWCVNQPWLDRLTRDLLQQTLLVLSSMN